MGVHAVLVKSLEGYLGTQVLDIDMLGVELSRGLFLAIHVIAEITSSDHDGVETEIDILLFLYRFFTVSLLAKASMTNCRFKGLSGVCFRRLKEKPNKRTVVKTNFPSSNGMISNPAATWFASNMTFPSWSSR